MNMEDQHRINLTGKLCSDVLGKKNCKGLLLRDGVRDALASTFLRSEDNFHLGF